MKAVNILAAAILPFAALSAQTGRVPLVSCGPDFNIWCPDGKLAGQVAENIDGGKTPVEITIHADGKTYRLCGDGKRNNLPGAEKGKTIPALAQTGVEVFPLHTVFSFAGNGLQAVVVFTNPKLPHDLDLFARPAAYVSIYVRGAEKWYASMSLPSAPFDGTLHLYGPLAAGDGNEAHFAIAFERKTGLRFFGKELKPWWGRDGAGFKETVDDSIAKRGEILQRAWDWSAELAAAIAETRDPEAVREAAVSLNEALSRIELAADANCQPVCIAKAADGTAAPAAFAYRDATLLLATAPTLCRAAAAPALLYSASPLWKHAFAPAGLGTYPECIGAGGAGLEKAGTLRQAETTAERLIFLAAIASIEGNGEFAAGWSSAITKWSRFLVRSAGKWKNSPCAVKCITALACCERLAMRRAEGRKNRIIAARLARDWAANAPGASNLPEETRFDLSWSAALGLDVFPPQYRVDPQDAGLSLLAAAKPACRAFTMRDKAATGVFAPLAAVAQSMKRPAKPFTIASFNIRCPADRFENAWSNRLPRVVQVIEKRGFDIFGVQEATPLQREDLDAALPGWARVGLGREGDDKGEAMCIYYKKDRFVCLGSDTFWLSETPRVPRSISWDSACRRVCTWGLFRDKLSGRRFRYYNTHLDHISAHARVKGMETILKEMRRLSQGETVFLTGDLNDSFERLPEEERERLLKGCGPRIMPAATVEHPIFAASQTLFDTIFRTETPHEGPEKTFHAYRTPNLARIDYIFASGDVRVLRHATCDDRPGGLFPSDHDAVSAVVLLP